MADETQTPAGWYRDPQNPDQPRYWDGVAWGGAQAVEQESTNGYAIASLVLGILWLVGIGSILALVFGYTAKKQIAASNGREGGGGMAAAGIVLGLIGVVLTTVYVLFLMYVILNNFHNMGG